MIRILNIIIFLIIITTFNSNAFGETKPDCSKYSTKTFAGLADKMNCKKGKPVKVRKKAKKWSDLNPFKPKENVPKEVLACTEHSTKSFTGLIAKLKCEKKWGY